jgi:hypothetical protein
MGRMAEADRFQLFSFGYYGWGTSTPELIEAVDAVERKRGFEPPIFVDIRIRRAVRAPGFNGNAFGTLLGEKRYRWLKALGNKQIETRSGPAIQIAQPGAVNELLDMAAEAHEESRRLIFFCGCEFPRLGGGVNCHRATVADLAIEAANRRGLKCEIVEWPGGEPNQFQLPVAPKSFHDLLRGRRHLPTGGLALAESASIAWGSTATIEADGRRVETIVGPAQFRRREWRLPVFSWHDGDALAELKAVTLRKEYGFEAQAAG